VFDQLQSEDVFEISDALESLHELGQNTHAAFVAQRASERLDIRTKVAIRSGNCSARHLSVIHGVTQDISNGGCMVLTTQPILAGDIFWLVFDDSHVSVEPILGRGMRCRMVQEGTFECGFRFFEEIDLSAATVDRR